MYNSFNLELYKTCWAGMGLIIISSFQGKTKATRNNNLRFSEALSDIKLRKKYIASV